MRNPKPKQIVLICLSVTLLASCRHASDRPGTPLYDWPDDLGRHVRLDRIPARIISLAPSTTEMLFSIGADSQVVGVTNYCDFPDRARLKPKVGTMLQPDIETIVRLRPDLVLMTVEGNRQETFRQLEDLGLSIYVMNSRSIEQILQGMRTLGEITGRAARAGRLCDSLEAVFRNLTAPIADIAPNVLLLVSLEPLMAAGGASFIDGLIRHAGGTNAASGLTVSYPVMSREEVIRTNPDVILLPDDISLTRRELLRRYPEWRFTSAARNGHIYSIDADVLQRPGPRIFSGLAALRRIIEDVQK